MDNESPRGSQGKSTIGDIVNKLADSMQLTRDRRKRAKDAAALLDSCCKKKRKRSCCGFKKRRLNCPGKRRYKTHVSGRACSRTYNNSRINLCNRNWARISVVPYINFLRVFRKKFSKCTPIEEINKKGMCQWKRMSKCAKKFYIEQAERARCRGFRT